MRELSAEQRQKLNFMLPTPNHCRKTLFLDLDETLVHTSTVPGTVLPNRLVVDCMGTNQEVSSMRFRLVLTHAPTALSSSEEYQSSTKSIYLRRLTRLMQLR